MVTEKQKRSQKRNNEEDDDEEEKEEEEEEEEEEDVQKASPMTYREMLRLEEDEERLTGEDEVRARALIERVAREGVLGAHPDRAFAVDEAKRIAAYPTAIFGDEYERVRHNRGGAVYFVRDRSDATTFTPLVGTRALIGWYMENERHAPLTIL
jgi:hypothetical protein